jgi:HD-GYP domain-containing protein (c-di-GMP phosphodiesterase class II)
MLAEVLSMGSGPASLGVAANTVGSVQARAALADAQALRAIQDMRDVRVVAGQERQARSRAEADLHRDLVETVRLLLGVLQRRWPDGAAHSREVARLAARLALGVGLGPNEAGQVQVAALLQDVGFLPMPDALLQRRPVALSPDARLRYEQHAALGQELLGATEGLAEVGVWIRHHHERWDGRGYPDSLAGEAIPLPSRIIAVTDAYVQAVRHEGGQAFTWRREQRRSGAFDRSLLLLLEKEIRRRPDDDAASDPGSH